MSTGFWMAFWLGAVCMLLLLLALGLLVDRVLRREARGRAPRPRTDEKGWPDA